MTSGTKKYKYKSRVNNFINEQSVRFYVIFPTTYIITA